MTLEPGRPGRPGRIVWGLVLGHPCWEPGKGTAGAAAGQRLWAALTQVLSLPDLKASLPLRVSILLARVWLLRARLNG